MHFLFLGILVLVIIILASGPLSRANPAVIARFIKRFVGVLSLLIAGFLAVSGRWMFAAPIAMFGASLLMGRSMGSMFGGPVGGGAGPSPSQKSTVRSTYFSMELDHDTGELDGDIIGGQYQGSRLSSLSMPDLLSLYGMVGNDPQSVSLLEAYLDRREPEWRDQFSGAQHEGADRGGSGAMSYAEAYAVLGLQEGATEQDIRSAHRRMMKQFHPDQGGSDYLATKINAAKDLLLGE